MNQYLSAIVLKNGDIVCNPEFQDIEISDDFARTNEFVRVEFFAPEDPSEIFDADLWSLEVNPAIPGWFNAKETQRKMANRVEKMFVQDKRNLLEGGCWILGEGADVEEVKNARVWGMFGNAQVRKMWDTSRVGKMYDSSQVKWMYDTSRVGEMHDSSRIEWMSNSSQVGVMCDTSRVGEMHDSSQVGMMLGSSRIEWMLDTSQVGKMQDSSQIRRMWDTSRVQTMREKTQVGGMWDTSQIGEMWDTSEINFIHTPAKIIIDKR